MPVERPVTHVTWISIRRICVYLCCCLSVDRNVAAHGSSNKTDNWASTLKRIRLLLAEVQLSHQSNNQQSNNVYQWLCLCLLQVPRRNSDRGGSTGGQRKDEPWLTLIKSAPWWFANVSFSLQRSPTMWCVFCSSLSPLLQRELFIALAVMG